MMIEGDNAIIETAEEAICLYHLLGVSDDSPYCISDMGMTFMDNYGDSEIRDEWKVTRVQVREAVTPKEGDDVLIIREYMPDAASPEYFSKWSPRFTDVEFEKVLKSCAITRGRVGELRELLAWLEDCDE